MFDKKGFMAFVGSNSGASYANGLENIEKVYNVDIDAEIEQDNCANLLSVIDADKKRLSDNDRKNRQNWYSHLRKYIEYTEKQPAERQKQRFIAWLKQQPQRNNPSKVYSDVTANAAVSKLQSGLKTLGVPGYENVNCFTITDTDTFRTLYQACYTAATESDKELGHSDFRNGLDFYLQFLTETAGGSDNTEMLKKIRFIIAHYKANFATTDEQERYKWEAIHWYKQHWNIDAPDFAKMLTDAFAKASTLLASSMYYPYRMITEYAQANPEAVRENFRILYNEDLPLEDRFQLFRQSCQSRIEQLKATQPDPSKPLNHYQDPRAMMVYLTFQYPEKYYFFKSTMYSTFRDRVGFVEPQSKSNSVMQKIENYTRLCEVILKEVHKDTELISMHQSRLNSNCYQDEALHLLTMDIVFYGGYYMSEDLFSAGENYWPPLKDYNPGITKDMWGAILQDKEVTTDEALRLLNMFMELGGESSFNNLVAHFGNQFYYKGTLQEFSTRVINKVNCAECPKEYKEFAKYIIPFVGRMVMDGEIKRDSWKLRDELKAALEQLDFWPSLAEYNPNLSKDDWKKYILEVELPNHPQPMQMLKALMEQNGQASCKRLSELYGGTPNRYVGCTTSLGRRAKKYFNLPACMDEGQERFFAIPFVGKRMLEGDKEYYVYRMRPELFAALKEINLSGVSLYVTGEEETMDTVTDVGLNTILYGPPGTGKTYHTVIYAVAIIENKELDAVKAEAYQDVLNRYNEYKTQGQIEFTTFHQSYGYEEFIEGIRPAVIDESDDAESGNIQYSVQPGVFKKFCEKADCPISTHARVEDLGISENATIWKVSLWSTGDNEVRTECLQNDHIRIGWDQYGKDITDETDFSADGGRVVLNAFINKMQIGDIVFSCYSASTIDAIGIVTGEYEWHEEYEFFRRVRKVNWLIKNIRENILSINGGTSMTLASVYRLSNIAMSDVYKIINKYQPIASGLETHKDNFVFIIDEINRGNISKIFGELITLIEESKRVGKAEGMKTLLPYSMKPFGVPENVYIIGTMNTADRSIATIDTALRRRFEFKEMLPDPEVVAKVSVGNLSVKEMLSRMNRRIAVLYDREHTIGHAYFMPLKDDNSIEKLAEIFKNKVIPLLQEYFYEDYEKIRLVLGDNQKKDERDQFILAKKINQSELFGSADIGLDDGFTYEINQDAFMNPEAYRQI